MSVLESLRTIRDEALEQFKNGQTAEELEQLRVSLLGKSGQLTGILRTMGKLAPEERAAVGAEANRVKQALEKRPHFDTARWPEGKPGLFIFSSCPMMIREIKQYRWKEDEEEPVKRDDHAMDELRYFIMSRPEPHAPERIPESMVVRHKKRLAKRNREAAACITR